MKNNMRWWLLFALCLIAIGKAWLVENRVIALEELRAKEQGQTDRLVLAYGEFTSKTAETVKWILGELERQENSAAAGPGIEIEVYEDTDSWLEPRGLLQLF